jgi:hypothetical protein
MTRESCLSAAKAVSGPEIKKEAGGASLMNHTKLEVKFNKMAFGACLEHLPRIMSNKKDEQWLAE